MRLTPEFLRGRPVTLALGCLVFAGLSALAAQASNNDPARRANDPPPLLETGCATKVAPAPSSPSEIKIVSYNIRWRGGDDLKKLVALLKEDPEVGGATIIGLQEVDRNKKRTGNANTVRVLAEGLGMHYVWAAPPPPERKDDGKRREEPEEETGVAILSPYPMTEVVRIVLPNEGPDGRKRAAVGATLHVGDQTVRVYSVHAETRMPVEKKVGHWRAVLEDLKGHASVSRVVILGDFNTIKGKDVRAARQLFTEAGFHTPFPDDNATFKVLFFDYKLDWVWLRGLTPTANGIDKEIDLSDHWPLWVKAKVGGEVGKRQ
jgi:endonuclease/exonuclease/phosphatase family metal-dependent hydrolase